MNDGSRGTTGSAICTVMRCEEPPVVGVTEVKGYFHRLCLKHLWNIQEDDTVELIWDAEPGYHQRPESLPEVPSSPAPDYTLPVTLSEPVLNEDGFYVGFRVVHPPGVECVFPLDTKQCSCGKMDIGIVTDESSTEPDPSLS